MNFFHMIITTYRPNDPIAMIMLTQLVGNERERLHLLGFSDEQINAAVDDLVQAQATLGFLHSMFIVSNPADASDPVKWGHLLRHDVMIDGKVHHVIGVESHAIPKINAGTPIGLLVADDEASTSEATHSTTK